MNDEEPKAGETAGDLIEQIGDVAGLSKLLEDKDVKAALISELRDIGFPMPGVVYRCLVFAAGKSEVFLGGALSSRLQAFIDRTPALANLVSRVANLHHGAKAKDLFKSELIYAIREGREFKPGIEVDDATSLEFAIALHSTQKLEALSGAIDTLGESLVATLKAEIATMAQEVFRPTLSWPEEATQPEKLSAYNRLKYTSGLDQFLGRDEEIGLLTDFAGDPHLGGCLFNFRWMLLTGEGGSGKTRLAYHFTTKVLNSDHWETGKLDISDLSQFTEPQKWRPRKPTFIVIDYAQSAPEDIHRLLAAFSRQSAQYEFPVRLLLLERSSHWTWTDKLLPETGGRPSILEHEFLGAGIEGRTISPLLPEVTLRLMAARIAESGLDEVSPHELLGFAHQIDPGTISTKQSGEVIESHTPRPLFALAAADALIDAIRQTGELPKSLSREEVLEGIVRRDRQTIWAKAIPDDALRRRYERGFALATLVQGLALSEMTQARFGNALDWLPPLPPNDDQTVLSAFGCTEGYWPQMEPDILGEFFFAQTLLEPAMPDNIRQQFLLGALELNKPFPTVSLLRLARDFPETVDRLDLPAITRATTKMDVAKTLAGLTIEFVKLVYDRGTLAERQLDALTDTMPKDRKIALAVAMAVANISIDAGIAGDWERIEALLLRLDKLREAFPKDHEIARAAALNAANISNYAGKAGDWARVAAMLSRLDVLRGAFPEDREIALREAHSAVNISQSAGKAGDWARIDEMLSRLDALRRAFPEHREIASADANAAVVISDHAGNAGEWARIDTMLSRLDVLREAFPKDREIALAAAQSAADISTHAGKAGDSVRLDAVLSRLDALRAAFPEEREIARAEGRSAINTSNLAGTADKWPRIDAVLSHLDALRAAFPKDRKIARADAQSAINISSNAGQAGDWKRIDAMLLRICALRAAFPEDREIGSAALQIVCIAVSVIDSETAQAHRLAELGTMMDPLVELLGSDMVVPRQGNRSLTVGFLKRWLDERGEEGVSSQT
ncbi:ATP-binding protein [Roseovarius aestuariivivens]|uniref:ATP-binding protein n=1 Tax=Roseovarius aestuariivivens TaxID=1888910 RepID=UPI00108135B3|nr:ATP-binding protein [Roseovarius aestuariivivens]